MKLRRAGDWQIAVRERSRPPNEMQGVRGSVAKASIAPSSKYQAGSGLRDASERGAGDLGLLEGGLILGRA